MTASRPEMPSYVDTSPSVDAVFDRVDIRIGMTLDEAERVLIMETLCACAGNKVHASRYLGVSLKTIYNRLAAYAAEEGRSYSATAHVYLAGHRNSPLVKIGYSSYPQHRVYALSVVHGAAMEVLALSASMSRAFARSLERRMHDQFDNLRTATPEWFDDSSGQIRAAFLNLSTQAA